MVVVVDAWRRLLDIGLGRPVSGPKPSLESAQSQISDLSRSFRYVEMDGSCNMRNASNTAMTEWIKTVHQPWAATNPESPVPPEVTISPDTDRILNLSGADTTYCNRHYPLATWGSVPFTLTSKLRSVTLQGVLTAPHRWLSRFQSRYTASLLGRIPSATASLNDYPVLMWRVVASLTRMLARPFVADTDSHRSKTRTHCPHTCCRAFTSCAAAFPVYAAQIPSTRSNYSAILTHGYPY
jgi:hypothetical protein